MRKTALWLAVYAAMTGSAGATTIVNSGGVVTVTYAVADISVLNASTLVLAPGGSATAPDAPAASFGTAGVKASGASSVQLAGGAVTGGGAATFGAAGIDVTGGSFTGTSGASTGGSSATGRGGAGLRTQGGTVIAISGGSYTGGNATHDGTFAGDGASLSAVTGQITGGSFTGGSGRDGSDPDFGGTGLSISDSSGLTLSGAGAKGGHGATYGGDGLELDAVTATILSGSYVGGEGGTFGGDALYVDGAGSVVTIYGGVFDGGDGAYLDGSSIFLRFGATANIYGGSFLDSFASQGGGTLNIYGEGFAYAGSVLTGTLLDGTPIDVVVASTITLNLYDSDPLPPPSLPAAPLPDALAFALGGLAMLAALALRRRPAAEWPLLPA